MEIFFFVLLLLAACILGTIGLSKGSFAALIVGCVLALLLGGLVLLEGISSEKIVSFDITDANVTPVYQTYSVSDDSTVFATGWLLIAGGFVFLVYSVYTAFTQPDEGD